MTGAVQLKVESHSLGAHKTKIKELMEIPFFQGSVESVLASSQPLVSLTVSWWFWMYLQDLHLLLWVCSYLHICAH